MKDQLNSLRPKLGNAPDAVRVSFDKLVTYFDKFSAPTTQPLYDDTVEGVGITYDMYGRIRLVYLGVVMQFKFKPIPGSNAAKITKIDNSQLGVNQNDFDIFDLGLKVLKGEYIEAANIYKKYVTEIILSNGE